MSRSYLAAAFDCYDYGSGHGGSSSRREQE